MIDNVLGIEELLRCVPEELCLWDVSLKPFSYLGIGGEARVLVFPETVLQLSRLITMCFQSRIPYFVLGKGSNTLLGDGYYDGLVISLQRMQLSLEVSGASLSLQGDIPLARLVHEFKKACLSGAEHLIGIPGTVCASLFKNAGTSEGAIGDIVQKIYFVDSRGKCREKAVPDLKFEYRKGPLEEGEGVIYGALFKGKLDSVAHIQERIDHALNYRKNTQPLGEPSLGCVFKNPGPLAASQLIDLAGCKNMCVGSIEVSSRHANFLVSREGGRARDYLNLIEAVRTKVMQHSGIYLQEEIDLKGNFQ